MKPTVVLKLPKDTDVILASGSPRRRELMEAMGVTFRIMPADCDESCPESMKPEEMCRTLAERKCMAVADEHPDSVVIGSDTLVELAGKPLGKPRSGEHAAEMLRGLSGNVHYVHTGIAVSYRGRMLSLCDTAEVHFRAMTAGEIEDYIATGEPMDKAGAYAIQGIGGRFVTHTVGDTDTIIGLSRACTAELIRRIIGTEGSVKIENM